MSLLKKVRNRAPINYKIVAHVLYEKWRDERMVKECGITLGMFKMDFLDRIFPLELRERKIQEFINVLQGNMSMKAYSLKYHQLYKYTRTMVADSKDKMNKFFYRVIRYCGK